MSDAFACNSFLSVGFPVNDEHILRVGEKVSKILVHHECVAERAQSSLPTLDDKMLIKVREVCDNTFKRIFVRSFV